MGDDVRSLDRSWSSDKITMLIDGEVEVDGELHVGLSAYEMRVRAESTSGDFSDLVVEFAQLERSIISGIQRDHQVRAAMLLRTRLGLDEHEIEKLLASTRPGYALLRRGVELVRRHEQGRRSQLRRVRAQRGESDVPLCWRCMKVEVSQPGQLCGESGCVEPEVNLGGRPKSGPGSTYDPTDQPDVASMTEEERQAEIATLVATQAKGPIPGGEHYRKRVTPIGGVVHDPADLRRADRAYRRGRPVDRLDGEVVPGV